MPSFRSRSNDRSTVRCNILSSGFHAFGTTSGARSTRKTLLGTSSGQRTSLMLFLGEYQTAVRIFNMAVEFFDASGQSLGIYTDSSADYPALYFYGGYDSTQTFALILGEVLVPRGATEFEIIVHSFNTSYVAATAVMGALYVEIANVNDTQPDRIGGCGYGVDLTAASIPITVPARSATGATIAVAAFSRDTATDISFTGSKPGYELQTFTTGTMVASLYAFEDANSEFEAADFTVNIVRDFGGGKLLYGSIFATP